MPVERLDNIRIVVSTDNYVNGETVPFKAKIIKEYEHETIVESLVTGREYELYDSQIFEYLSIKEISNMIDLSKYGEFCNE